MILEGIFEQGKLAIYIDFETPLDALWITAAFSSSAMTSRPR